jgi:hypothetical protein
MINAQIHYKRNKHQDPFHQDVTSKFLHLSTGFGGGKSTATAMKLFQLSWINQGFDSGCVVPSIADYKKDLLPIMEDTLHQNRVRYHYHQTDKVWTFPWSRRGRVYIASAEKSLRGPNWASCVINELGEIQHLRYREAIGRVRVKGAVCSQIASSGTPEGVGHWIYESFIERPMKGSRIIYGDTRDNQENLSDDYVASLMDSYDATMIDAYVRGLFVNMSGHRFYYSYDPLKNLSKKISYNPALETLVSLDFNVDPMCATLWQIENTDVFGLDGRPIRRANAFGQIEISGPEGARTEKMCDALKAHGCDPDRTVIYPDPAGRARSTSGPPDIEILKKEGFLRIKVKTVAPNFRKRQLAVNNLLDKALIQINPDECKGLKKDLEAVEQDISTYEKIKTNPKLTHFSDGMDYFVDIEFPLSGNKPESKTFKYR